MKYKVLNTALSITLAIYILCVSGGANIYHFCCDACRSYGYNIFTTITCDEVHSHHHCSEQGCNHGTGTPIHTHDDLCSHLAQSTKHCDIHHIDAPQLNVEQITPALPLIQCTAILTDNIIVDILPATSGHVDLSALPNAPPLPGGRAILALKRSYLI